jgi:hypothetical protein
MTQSKRSNEINLIDEMNKRLIDKKEETFIEKYFCCFNKRSESFASDDLPSWATNDGSNQDGKISKKKILSFTHN